MHEAEMKKELKAWNEDGHVQGCCDECQLSKTETSYHHFRKVTYIENRPFLAWSSEDPPY